MAKIKKKDRKVRDLLLANFIIIMFVGVLIAIESEVIGIAKVVADAEVVGGFNLTTEIVNKANVYMNSFIAIAVGVYALLHAINYGLYLYKKDGLLKVFMIIDFLVFVGCIIFKLDPLVFDIYLVPVISGLIYLKVLKIEE